MAVSFPSSPTNGDIHNEKGRRWIYDSTSGAWKSVINSTTIDTDTLLEGTNLFYTDERVDDRVSTLLIGGNNITTVYDDAANTLTINGQPGYTDSDVDARIAATSVDALSDVDITTSAPTSGQALIWDNANSKFIPGDSFSQSDFDSAFTAKDTDALSEGSTNLYYTDARADTRATLRITAADIGNLNNVSGTSPSNGDFLLYDSGASEFAPVAFATEVNTYADARISVASIQDLSDVDGVDTPANGDTLVYDGTDFGFVNFNSETNSLFDTRFATKSTTDLAEGTNLYYTDARADARVSAALATDVVIGGNLTVNGTTTTLNTATLDVEDLNITVASGAANAAAANGAGLTVAGANATITYDSTNDEWDLNKDINVTGSVRASQPFFTNSQTVTENHTVATGESAMAAGPVTVNSGVTVTVSSGSRWVIV